MASLRELRGVLALAAALAALAGPAWAYPHWSSDQLRAARSTAPAEALVFDLETTITPSGKPAVVTRATVTLAATFTDQETSGNHVTDDHSLCRTLTWKAGDKVFENYSCYASPAFRLIELQNRAVLGSILGKAKIKSGTKVGPYWDEADLGLQGRSPPPLVADKTGDRTEYRLDGDLVARVSGSGGPASADEMRRLGRFLARNVKLHPLIRRDVVAGAGPPAVVESEFASLGVMEERRVMRFSNLRRVQVTYPLPPGLGSAVRARATEAATPQNAAVREALLVIDRAAPKSKPSLADLAEGMSAAKTPLEAMLLFSNLTQQYGAALMTPGPDREALVRKIGPILRRIKQDPEVQAYQRANELAGDPKAVGDREASAQWLASMGRLDALPFGTFRLVTYANLVRNSTGADKWGAAARLAMPEHLADNYWIHIATYPWASNAYKDVGDLHFSSFDTTSAWQAYDLGRAVDSDWRMGVMANVEGLEARVQAAAPDFF